MYNIVEQIACKTLQLIFSILSLPKSTKQKKLKKLLLLTFFQLTNEIIIVLTYCSTIVLDLLFNIFVDLAGTVQYCDIHYFSDDVQITFTLTCRKGQQPGLK